MGARKSAPLRFFMRLRYARRMRLCPRKLTGIPVKTRSGNPVGKLADFLVETDTGRIEFLLVRTGVSIPGLMHQELQIAWSQVITLTEKEAIVADGSVPAGSLRLAGVLPKMPGISET